MGLLISPWHIHFAVAMGGGRGEGVGVDSTNPLENQLRVVFDKKNVTQLNLYIIEGQSEVQN